jgi:type IV pilus assembly protein PilW
MNNFRAPYSLASNRGFSLIEIMIAVVLSMIALLVILEVFQISEARKNITSGAADAQQTGSLNLYQTGRVARMGGSGLTQGDRVWGCILNASRGGNALVPPAGNYPAPFDTLPTATRVFPATIFPGQGFVGNGSTSVRGSDVVVAFGGDGESGQVQYDLAAAPLAGANPSVIVQGPSNGFRRGDLLLAVQADRPPDNCWIAQVNAKTAGVNAFTPFTPGINKMQTNIPLDNGTDGPYNVAGGLSNVPAGQGARIVNLGRAPNFMAYAVNAQNQLVQYDFLNLPGAATNQPLVIAENVVDFRALLGISNPAGSAVTWVSPAAASPYSAASLATTPNNADFIVAVRFAMVVRTNSITTEANPPTTYTLFPDLTAPLSQTVTIATNLQQFRHQVYDSVMPVKNMRFVPPTR